MPCNTNAKKGSTAVLKELEAAAVKLENQRLREEIRAMCNTIKSQSSQLSELWAETQRLQAQEPSEKIEKWEGLLFLMFLEWLKQSISPVNSTYAGDNVHSAPVLGSPFEDV